MPGSAVYKEIEQSCGEVKPQRFRNLGTLRPSVMALRQYAPWIRKVFVVTAGEKPCWVDGDAELGIEMISHKQIYPREVWATDLPTHDSNAIESHLHRIPGLAECFIYLNNDQFIGRPVAKQSFFDSDGKAILAGTHFDDMHMPTPVRKSVILQQQRENPQKFAKMSHIRCRKTVAPPFFDYARYHLARGYAKLSPDPISVAFLRDTNMKDAGHWCTTVKAQRPQRFTINDDFDETSEEHLKKQQEELASFLRDYFKDIPGVSETPAQCLKTPAESAHPGP